MAPRGGQRGGAASSTALAPADTGTDELAGLAVDDDADDGLGEVSGEDIKIAAKIFNMKGKDDNGRQIPSDVFYDTVERTYTEELDAAFLYLHKTNAYTVYNNELSKNETVCRSFDRVTGTIEATGVQRPCKGCPDDQWYTEGGKRKKNCGAVYSMAALDRKTRMPFWIRFKRTSLPVIRQHLNRHHIGRRPTPQGRKNYPLYAFQVTLRCTMSDDGKYALPVIERGPRLEQEEYDLCKESAGAIRENLIPMMAAIDAQMAGAEGPVDTSFDPGAMGSSGAAAGAGEDFVE